MRWAEGDACLSYFRVTMASAFSPFDTARYFLPFRPVEVSPINIARFLQGRGLRVMASELLWIWLPALVVAGGAEAVRLGASSRRPAPDGKAP